MGRPLTCTNSRFLTSHNGLCREHHYRRFQQEVLHWSSPQSYTRATPSDFAAVISNANSRKNYTSNERHLRVGIRALDGAGARRTLTLSKTDALCLPAGFAYVGHPRICQSGITGPPNSVEAIVEWVGGPPFLRLVPSLRRTNPHQHNSLSVHLIIHRGTNPQEV
ncbi:hypothetical protein IAQ61_006115 [Plenodomus lingam]|uniref:uncharacterized protein n=1 Tax=Leptosphaeria maculans TaxID=5022 RepID=UPI003327C7A1|nr:hypothetical protein IAQ61_006115 [Plenodomus lingam]